jgi:hypothetical protein
LLFPLFACWPSSFGDPLPAKFVFLPSGLRTALGASTTQAQAIQTAYNSSQQELEELRAAVLEACQGVEEGEAQAESSMASHLRALGRHVPSVCSARFTWGSRRPLAWWRRTTRLTSG